MELKLIGERAYLELPISGHAVSKRLWIYCGGKLQDTIDVRLDYLAPEYCAYYPIARYKGQEMTLKTTPAMQLQDRQTDTPDYRAAEAYPFRPHWHFAPKFGWMNDPNGLVAYTSPVTGKTTYHLFFQYNPYDTVWANMHWGHAVSDDLLHWKELPVAIYPDEYGTIYSGCALVDTQNVSGLQEGQEKVILLYYTSAGGTNGISLGQTFTQCLAYSTDGGLSFRKYQHNPVLPTITRQTRDPKVIWCEELQCYVMALYVSDWRDTEYQLYTSKDLLHWEKLQNIWLEEDTEFPDLYPLTVAEEPESKYWVFTGCRQTYLLCKCIPGEGFRPVQAPKSLVYGINAQAPQTFSDVPDQRRICITWHRNMFFPSPTPISTQQSIPYTMTLRKHRKSYYLAAWPIEEVSTLYKTSETHRQVTVEGDTVFQVPLEAGAYDIFITLPRSEEGEVTLRLFGGEVTIHCRNNTITAKSGSVALQTMPLSATGAEKSLRILVDRCSMELFSDGGTSMMPVSMVCDYNLACLEVSSREGAVLEELTIHRLCDRK